MLIIRWIATYLTHMTYNGRHRHQIESKPFKIDDYLPIRLWIWRQNRKWKMAMEELHCQWIQNMMDIAVSRRGLRLR